MYNSPDTYNLHYNDAYAFNASTSGIEIYDVDTESVVKYVAYPATYSGAEPCNVTSVWASPTKAYFGTTNSGIYTLDLGYITSVSGVVDLASYLVSFKKYPDITNNHVTYIHGAGDYLCITTISGVDHFNLGHSDAYHRSHTIISPDTIARKCFQTSRGRFYYVTGAAGLETTYCRRITFDAVTTDTNYQIQITLTAANFDYSHVNADGSDIRFYDLNDNKLDYFIWTWSYGGTSTIWVEVTDVGTEEIKICYGNPDAVAESNADATFQLYDHFTGTSLNGSKWPTVNEPGQITVAGSWVQVDGNVNYPYIQGAYILDPPLIVEQYLDVDSVTGNNGFQHFENRIRGNDDGARWYKWGSEWYVGFNGAWAWNDGTAPFTGTGLYTTYIKPDGIRVTWISGMDESWVGTTNSSSNRALRLFGGYTGSNVNIDWVRVRRYDVNSPAVSSIGPEGRAGGGIDRLEAIYTYQCDWDENNTGYTYYTSTSGNLLPREQIINDLYIVEGTSTYGQNNNLIFVATTSGVALIEERPGDEANSRYKHYLVEG